HRPRRLQRVRHDAVVLQLAAEYLGEPAQREAVRVVDASGPKRFAGHHELVAGEEQAEPEFSVDRQGANTDGGGKPGVLRQQSLAGWQDLGALGDVARGAAHPLAWVRFSV